MADEHQSSGVALAALAQQEQGELPRSVQLLSPPSSSSSSSLLDHFVDDWRLPAAREPSADPINDADVPSSSPAPPRRCSPAPFDSLVERAKASAVITEAHALQPLFHEALQSTASALSSFTHSSCGILIEYARSSPRDLHTAVVSFYQRPSSLRLELLLGLSLSALLVVDAIAFSVLAGALPIVGMYACFLLTLFTSLLGGCPGMISGAAGSTAAVQATIVSASGVFSHLSADERLQVLFLTLLLAGVLEVLVGWLGLAQLSILIPAPVFVGFLDGLAIIILIAQLAAFQFCPTSATFTDCSVDERRWLPADELSTWLTAVQLLLALAIMEFVHRLPVPYIQQVPAVLIAVVIGCCVEHGIFRAAIDHPTRTVNETAAISGRLPTFSFPVAPASLASSDVGQVILQSVLVAFVGLVESILTLQALNVKKQQLSTARDFNTESMAQGVGNIVCSVFGALGGCALVGESSLNVTGGSRSRLSTFTAAWAIFIYTLVLYDVVNLLPIATVSGIMFSIVLHMFQFHSTFAGLLRLHISDSLTICAVTAISVAVNLSIGVLVGILMQALVFAWAMRSAEHFAVSARWTVEELPLVEKDPDVTAPLNDQPDAKSPRLNAQATADSPAPPAVLRVHVRLRGVLYFGSVAALLADSHPDALMRTAATSLSLPSVNGAAANGALSSVAASPAVHAVLDLRHCPVVDYSGCWAVDDVLKEWRMRGWSAEVFEPDDARRRLLLRVQPITPSRQSLIWSDARPHNE